MKEVGLCAGGAKRGRDLARNDAALADAGDDDAARAFGELKQQIGRLREGREHRVVETRGQLVESGGFDANELRGAQGI